MIINDMGLAQAKGLGRSLVRVDQAMFWNDCNQIGSGNVRSNAVPLFP